MAAVAAGTVLAWTSSVLPQLAARNETVVEIANATLANLTTTTVAPITPPVTQKPAIDYGFTLTSEQCELNDQNFSFSSIDLKTTK